MKRISIRLKIALILLLTSLILSLAILVIVRQINTSNINNKQITMVNDYIDQTEKSITTILNDTSLLNSSILQSGSFQQVIQDESMSVKDKSNEFNNLVNNLNTRTFISSIRIYSIIDNNYFISGVGVSELRNPSPQFINNLKESKTNLFLPGHIETDVYGVNNLVIGKKIINTLTQELLGYSFYYIDIKNLTLGDFNHQVYIIDSNHQVIYDNKNLHVGELVNDNYLVDDKNVYQRVNINNEDLLIFNSNLFEQSTLYKDFNWRLITSYQYPEVFGSIILLNWIILIVLIIVVASTIIITILISRRLSKSLSDLNKNIVSFTNDLTVPNKSSKYHNDEIGDLERAYDEMIMQIINLIEQNVEEQEIKRKLELEALQMQINPHFLYNTLDAIAWTAKLKKETSIEKLVLALAKFFRLSLHKGDKYISLEDEIELIYHFLEIELIRFPEKFEVTYDIQESIKKEMVLKLILQPIVENAIKHGISQLDRNGNIHIKAYESENKENIIFEIIDDGIGFDQSDQVNDKSKLSGFGIHNLRERIRLEYGPNYGVELESEKNSGTKATITIKKLKI